MAVIVSIKNKQLDNIQTPAVQMFSFWGSLVCSSWHLFSQKKALVFSFKQNSMKIFCIKLNPN